MYVLVSTSAVASIQYHKLAIQVESCGLLVGTNYWRSMERIHWEYVYVIVTNSIILGLQSNLKYSLLMAYSVKQSESQIIQSVSPQELFPEHKQWWAVCHKRHRPNSVLTMTGLVLLQLSNRIGHCHCFFKSKLAWLFRRSLCPKVGGSWRDFSRLV